MKIRSIAIVLATAGTLLATAVSASASTAAGGHVYKAGKCTASGQDASCQLPVRNMRRPRSAFAHVTASPAQSVLVSLDVTCFARSGASASSSPSATVQSPDRYKIRLPMRRPHSCSINGFAQLEGVGNPGFGNGTVSLRITYHRR